MNSILCDNEEYPQEEAKLQRYYFSARMAELQNISERICTVDYQQMNTKKIETILFPDDNPSTRYKHIIEGIPEEPKPEKIIKPLRKEQKKISVKKPGLKQQKDSTKKNYIKDNINQLKITDAPHITQPNSNSSRKKIIIPNYNKPNKNISTSENVSLKSTARACESNYNPQLLSLVFKQFTDVVLLQWEEAADLLIDEILLEEISFLNSLENNEKEEKEPEIIKIETVNNVEDLLMEINRIQEFKEEMKRKYL